MSEREPEDPFADSRMTLAEHLDELRIRLIRGGAALVIAFVAAWVLRDPISKLATQPYLRAMDWLEVEYVEQGETLLAADPALDRTEFFLTGDADDTRLKDFNKKLAWIRPHEYFFFQLRLALYAAFVIGAPVLLWQMWQFIAAGLYSKEKRAISRYFPLSVIAFGVGVVFGFLAIVPYGIYFLNKSASIELGLPSITAEYYLTFLSGLCLSFGIVFQLPLVMSFLGGAGIVDPAAMGKFRGYFALAAVVISAMLTPPDPFTQLMMAVPLVVLYEVGIWGAKLVRKP